MATVKHSLYFVLGEDNLTEALKKILTEDDKLNLQKIMPAPNNRTSRTLAEWKRNNWGSENSFIPVARSPFGFSFVSETCDLRDLMTAISKIMGSLELSYRYASSELGTITGHCTLANGICTEEKKIQDKVRFACSVWGLSYADYLEKHTSGTATFADDIQSCEHDEDFDLMDSILAGEDT